MGLIILPLQKVAKWDNACATLCTVHLADNTEYSLLAIVISLVIPFKLYNLFGFNSVNSERPRIATALLSPSGLWRLKECTQPRFCTSKSRMTAITQSRGLQKKGLWAGLSLSLHAATGLVKEKSYQGLSGSRPKCHCVCALSVCFAATLRDDLATCVALWSHLRQRRRRGCVSCCPGNRRSCCCLVASERQVLVMQLKHLRTLLSPQVRSCVPLPSPSRLNFPRKVGELKINNVEHLLCSEDWKL